MLLSLLFTPLHLWVLFLILLSLSQTSPTVLQYNCSWSLSLPHLSPVNPTGRGRRLPPPSPHMWNWLHPRKSEFFLSAVIETTGHLYKYNIVRSWPYFVKFFEMIYVVIWCYTHKTTLKSKLHFKMHCSLDMKFFSIETLLCADSCRVGALSFAPHTLSVTICILVLNNNYHPIS